MYYDADLVNVVKELRLKMLRKQLACCKAVVTFKHKIYQRKSQC